MPTPLVATWRIVLKWTALTHAHSLKVYVKGVSQVLSIWKITTRTNTLITWSDAAQDLATAIDNVLGNDIGGSATAVLEQLSAGIWNQIATATVTLAGASGGASRYGWQSTFVFRDSTFKQVKLVLIEPNVTSLAHWTSPTAGGTSNVNLQKEFTSSKTLTNAPWNWLVGRSENYLQDASFIGGTQATNRKIRRRAGLT